MARGKGATAVTVTANAVELMELDCQGVESEIQHVIFSVYTEEYGVDVLNVKGIIGYTEPLQIPLTPAWVRGVIHYQGAIIPVFDLRCMFGLKVNVLNENTVIIICGVKENTFGLVVDKVTDIINLPEAAVRPVNDTVTGWKTRFLKAMGQKDDRVIFLLDLNRVVEMQNMEMNMLSLV
ncbi:MAG TPA: chemotaxis protein CheW [Bacillota bacterium]|nr:chemotaxis protein CheW [Bacillota bacterium]